jgi:hypothetical protein
MIVMMIIRNGRKWQVNQGASASITIMIELIASNNAKRSSEQDARNNYRIAFLA